MTIELTYTGKLDFTDIYTGVSFFTNGPDVKADADKETITFSDPHNKKSSVVFETKNLVTDDDGQVVSGKVSEIHLHIGGKEALSITGLDAEANTLMPAAAGGVSSIYEYLSDSLSGSLIGTGDKFMNILEVGEGGNARLDGGGGDDQLYIWHKKNVTFDGGAGTDKVIFDYEVGSFDPPEKGVTIDLQTGKGTNPFGGTLAFKGVENITGTRAADVISGNGGANVLYGGLGGEDVIRGRGGDDVVSLAAGLDGAAKFTADGGSGKDGFIYDISFGSDSSTIDLAHQQNNSGIFAHSKISNFETYTFYDFTFDGSHRDIHFIGTSAAETIILTKGDDIIEAGRGDDAITGGAGENVFRFIDHFGKDRIVDFSVDEANVIEFDKDVFEDFQDVKSHTHKNGFDLVIDAGDGDKLTLSNIKLNQLNEDDFSFV